MVLVKISLALALVGLICTPAVALTPTGELQAMMADVTRVLSDPATEGRLSDRVSAILDLVDRRFAFSEAAEGALGPPWAHLTSAAQAEFVALFADLFERAFVMAVGSTVRLDEGLVVTYRSESISGRSATVLTTVVAKDGRDLPVAYRMVRQGETWLIADVSLNGVSFVDNYRAQFERVIRMSSYEALIARLQARRLDVPEWWPAPRTARVRQTIAAVREPVDLPVTATEAPRPRDTGVAAVVSVASVVSPPAVDQAPPPASPPLRGRTMYWLQAGAFRDTDRVSRLESALVALKLKVSISAAEVPTGSGRVQLTRVRVGPFADLRTALAVLADLRQLGYAPFVAADRD